MRSPTKPLETYTGAFESVSLAFIPDLPLPSEQLSHDSANYPTEQGFVHVYLGGRDATERLPSAYVLWLLDDLLSGLAALITGQATTASALWYDDPWRFDLRGDVAHNRLYVTLHAPGRWVALQDVSVPLDAFAEEVVRVGQLWKDYLDSLFHEELIHPEWGQQIRIFDGWLERARQALAQYMRDEISRDSPGHGQASERR